MSNSDPSLDELVSAYIDGEATDDEIARVESDPELLARAHIFRSIDAIVAEPVAPPANSGPARESAIAAALAASSTTAKVTSLAPKQSAKPSFFERQGAALMGAAAVLFVLLAGFAVLNNNLGGNEDFATSSDAGDASGETESFDEVGIAGAGSGDDDASDADAMSTEAAQGGADALVDEAEEAMEEEAMEEEAMEEEAMEEEAPAEEAMEEEADVAADDDSGSDAETRAAPTFATLADIEAAYSPELVEERLAQDNPEQADAKADRRNFDIGPCSDGEFIERILSLVLVDIVDLAPNGEVVQTIYVFVDPSTEEPSTLVLADLAACAEVSP